ncbi:MAG: carboxynorspermidine decarboxylase [Selenomonadaceae bacterium]|nr:carboxynorspermidine decarboxylase [Selenomonadaceae bacterium]
MITPAYVVDEKLLTRNLEILAEIQQSTGAKILLAQKCFSAFYFYPLIKKFLAGTAASGLYEARLAAEYFGGENHVYAPAYKAEEIAELAQICDHVIFNSFAQVEKFAQYVKSAGLRINPEHSTQKISIYDPCAENSRLGVRIDEFKSARLDLIEKLDGLHFHTLCEQNSDALEETVDAVEEKFGAYLHKMKWLNLGGGHHITRKNYDIERLKKIIRRLQETYGVEIYLEPGEAVALDAGFLVAQILEIQPARNGISNAIIDASAACHMPDVLEMPYRPEIIGAAEVGVKNFSYRFGGATCLAGDVIGEYSFDKPLSAGDEIIFRDMAIYTMVKNNTFNGAKLPAIYAKNLRGDLTLIKNFGYDDFKNRLS